jgi:hypothetical protein
MGRTVLAGDWRYTEWHDGSAELYHHSGDPFEYANLAKNPQHGTKLAEMKKLLAEGWKAGLPK